MSKSTESRRFVRFKIKDGRVLVYHPVMPSLHCSLVDLSEMGARCVTRTDDLDAFTAQAWRKLFAANKPLSVEIVGPEMPARCKLEAEVRHVKLNFENELEVGMEFRRVDSLQQSVITKTLATFSKYGRSHQLPSIGPVPKRPAAIQNAPLKTPVPAPPPTVTRKTSIFNIARNLFGGKPESPASASDAARKAVPASVSNARLQAVQTTSADLPRATPVSVPSFRGMKVGEILLRLGKLTPEQAVEAYEASVAAGEKFGRYLVSKNLVSPAELCRALSLQSGLPIVDLSSIRPPDAVFTLFPHEMLERNACAPFNLAGGTVFIAALFPLTKKAVLEMEKHCGKTLKVFLAQDDALLGILDLYKGTGT